MFENYDEMNAIQIEGQQKLEGYVEISGAKNSALPNMAATLLTSDEVVLHNIPNLLDTYMMAELLKEIGADIYQVDEKSYSFKMVLPLKLEAPFELVNKMRASILVLGPMLARFHQAKVYHPGGCSIGSRPIDLHLDALKKMGAEIDVQEGFISATAPKGLKGAEIRFPKITVTGTENILMAAVLAKGETVIHNAAKEPEVIDLVRLLRKMGAKIKGEGTETIVVEGVKELHGTEHTIIPDRIEAGTFAVIGALTEGNIVIKNYPSEYLEFVDKTFKKIGIDVLKIGENEVIIKKAKKLNPVQIETKEYPFFPTDLQAQFMTLLSLVEGKSIIIENIFENRFMHIAELKRLGADIQKGDTSRVAIIKGVKKLEGAKVNSTDLRASAAMVIAGLVAEGTTTIHNIYHLDRGYEHIDDKLKNLGAKLKRIKVSQDEKV